MIAILVAMEEELSGIVEQNTLEQAKMRAYPNTSVPFAHVLDEKRDVLFVLSGIGRANTAAAAQWAIDSFDVDVLLNFGTGGSLDASVRPGSIVIATGCVSADFDITAFGHEKGFITGTGKIMGTDDVLAQKATRIAIESEIPHSCGIVATNDAFISDADKARDMADRFDAIACDMEASAACQVAKRNAIPFLAIKKISDEADEDAREAFEKLEQEKHDIASSARIIIEKLISRI